jgi:hypothetical protein
MVLPARFSQVGTRGESIISYIHRVSEPDVIQDSLDILQVVKWAVLSVSMYCLIQLYMSMSTHPARHKSMVNLLSIQPVGAWPSFQTDCR